MVQCRAQRQRASGSTQARHNQQPKANKQLRSPREDEALVGLESKSALRHRDIVGHIQRGKVSFGYEKTKPMWQKTIPAERRHLVVEEVRPQKAERCAKAMDKVECHSEERREIS